MSKLKRKSALKGSTALPPSIADAQQDTAKPVSRADKSAAELYQHAVGLEPIVAHHQHDIHHSHAARAPPLPSLRGDVLWGAKMIADELNRDVRDVYYLLQQRRLPAAKVGDVWVTTRSKLRAFIERDLEVA